jgi:hypothetical protein
MEEKFHNELNANIKLSIIYKVNIPPHMSISEYWMTGQWVTFYD